MRPTYRNEFLIKLADVAQREFLCDKSVSAQYIERLTLGNYH